MPIKKGALTWDFWRYQNEGQAFSFEVLFTEKDGEARGSVLCTVHAENLTKPETARVGSRLNGASLIVNGPGRLLTSSPTQHVNSKRACAQAASPFGSSAKMRRAAHPRRRRTAP
jgi:hypothetical protein